MKIDISSRAILLGAIATIVASCAAPDTRHHIVISTREQKLAKPPPKLQKNSSD